MATTVEPIKTHPLWVDYNKKKKLGAALFGAVACLALCALVLFIFAIVLPDWMTQTLENDTTNNKTFQVKNWVGLWTYSQTPECMSDECRDFKTKAQPASSKGDCESANRVLTGDSDAMDCKWDADDNYCRCPIRNFDAIEKALAASKKCSTAKDTKSDDAESYVGRMKAELGGARVGLCAACVLCAFGIICAVVALAKGWFEFGLVSCLAVLGALVLSCVGLGMGVEFARRYGLQGYCGSRSEFDTFNDGLNADQKTCLNLFPASPIMALVGICLLALAALLALVGTYFLHKAEGLRKILPSLTAVQTTVDSY